MLTDLRSRLDALEDQRAAFLAPLHTLPPAARSSKPSPKAWSLDELVHHLLLIDAQALTGMAAAFAEPPCSAGPTARLRFGLLRRVLAWPLRIPAPPGAEGVLPRDTPDFATLDAEWTRIRSAMATLLATATPDRLGAAAFRHPLLGRFTLLDTLDFLHTHHAHHAPQRRRLLARVDQEPSELGTHSPNTRGSGSAA